jgi:protein tyrosine/serine phosphatase
MRTIISITLGCLIAALTIIAPIYYMRWRDREYRNFRTVQEGVLYRSGQLPLPRLQQLVSQYGIRCIVSLRDGHSTADEGEESWAKAKTLHFVRIPYRSWYPDASGKVPADESVKTFRDVMDNPANYPVLVHCFAGIHRTGTMCAVFRMDYQGWTNDEAMNEMRASGYTILEEHEDVFTYLIRYRSPREPRAVPALPAGLRKHAVP